jgi:hypothetical protein
MAINYIAVLVAQVVFFLVGWAWYSQALFGNAWMKAVGKTAESIEKEKAEKNMGKAMAINFLGGLVMVFVTAHLINYMFIVFPESNAVSIGLMTAFWVWLGYIAMFTLNQVTWEGKSWSFYFITVGYQLVGLLIIGVILAVWR